jgi:hypothetical protein
MGNLILAFDSKSSSVGSRIGVQQNVWDLDGLLCSIVQQAGLPQVTADLACTLFEEIVETGLAPDKQQVQKMVRQAQRTAGRTAAERDPRSGSVQQAYAQTETATVDDLFGGGS